LASVGASKSGAATKDKAPPAVMRKSARSMPPVIENVSGFPSGSVAVAV
jgi:hypothetical protein